MLSTSTRYNITDKHLFKYISIPFSFKSASIFNMTPAMPMDNSMNTKKKKPSL